MGRVIKGFMAAYAVMGRGKMALSIILAGCIAFFANSICFATEWQDKTFDFLSIRTIVVQLSADNGVVLNESDKIKLNDLLVSQVIKSTNQRVRLIPYSQLEAGVGEIMDMDMGKLRSGNNHQYKENMQEYTPFLANGFLNVNIKALSITQEFVPEKTYTYTEYVTTYVDVPVYTPDGQMYYSRQAIQVPVERVEVIPAHYEAVSHAGAEVTLVTTKGQQLVWSLQDMRNSTKKAPLAITADILKQAADRLRILTDYKVDPLLLNRR